MTVQKEQDKKLAEPKHIRRQYGEPHEAGTTDRRFDEAKERVSRQRNMRLNLLRPISRDRSVVTIRSALCQAGLDEERQDDQAGD